jgi:hypothetical protein
MNNTMMTKKLIEDALEATQCIISVMGDHAGEGVDKIFKRKIEDITKINRTFWLVKSPKAKPELVQKMCRFDSTYVVFVEPATKGGARPAIADKKATTFSENGFIWNPLPNQLGPVTGKLDSRAYALVFNKLETIAAKQEMDLWHYADFVNQEKPIRMILEPYNKFSTLFAQKICYLRLLSSSSGLGSSTVCAIKKDMKGHPERLKSRFRRVVAVGLLVAPYCVWVR